MRKPAKETREFYRLSGYWARKFEMVWLICRRRWWSQYRER